MTTRPGGGATIVNLGIDPEDFDIIPPNQDFCFCDYSRNALVKLSRTYLTNFVGDLLITDAGEASPPSKFFIVKWDGTNFVARSLSYSGQIEHGTFAPINIRP